MADSHVHHAALPRAHAKPEQVRAEALSAEGAAVTAEGNAVLAESRPARPALRYHGGKWLLSDWLLRQFPRHRVYVEPFGGGGSVLLRKPRSYAEVYNDLDSEIVSFFRVLQNKEQSAELERLLRVTPFAREEFVLALDQTTDPIEKARRLVIRSFMGFGSAAHNSSRATGFRACSNRSGTTPAHDWVNYQNQIRAFCARLSGVVIENRPAIDVILQHDSPETLHYCDPPYVHATRKKRQAGNYRFEMSDDDHADLARALSDVSGMVIVSGYRCDLYDSLYSHWTRIDARAHADGARARVESVWINDHCMRHAPQPGLLA